VKKNIPDMNNNIIKLQETLGYEFQDRSMIAIAISHPGLKRRNRDCTRKFEKLEFLGDRVLGLSLSDFLYHNFPEESEGDLAVRIASLAGTDFLISLAKKMKILDCFCIPKDFFVSNHKNSSSIADMMEAVFGCIFLDSNFETAKNIIIKLWGDNIYKTIYKKKDAKSRLQEIVQAETSQLPVYRLVKMVGEAHDPVFEIEVSACGETLIGQGNTKKNAEHDAAEKMIAVLCDKEG
jgi:ribonuclease-3